MRASLVLVLSFAVCAPAFADESPPAGGDHPAVAHYRHRAERATVNGIATDARGQVLAGVDVFAFGFQRQACPSPQVPAWNWGGASRIARVSSLLSPAPWPTPDTSFA